MTRQFLLLVVIIYEAIEKLDVHFRCDPDAFQSRKQNAIKRDFGGIFFVRVFFRLDKEVQ